MTSEFQDQNLTPNRKPNCMLCTLNVGRYLAITQRAGAAIEFALSGLALLIFLMAIINLGDLGLTLGALEHGIQASARETAIQTTANLATNGTVTCPTDDNIRTYFNNFAAPPLPAATGSPTDGSPIVTAAWVDNVLGTTAGVPPTLYLNLNVAYTWYPIGLPAIFKTGIKLGMTAVATVIGPAGMPAC
jgi:hypothetical protein